MKKILFSILATLFLSSIAFGAEVTLLKRTIHITPQRFLRFWKDPKAAEPVYDTYSWVPKIKFDVIGPISGGSKIYVEFDTPAGKPWLKYNMRTPELEEDYSDTVTMDESSTEVLEKMGTTALGIFPFRIKMKNALAGTDQVLFSGKIKVGNYLLDQKIPEFKNKKDFYIDYDWHMAFGYLWLDPRSDQEAPQLATQFVLRGDVDDDKLEAYLFYNGKQIAKQGLQEKQEMSSGADEPSHRWGVWETTFSQIRGFNKTEHYKEHFRLDKNPGEYEIKLMRDNNLSRSLKFTVGTDGKIVDNLVAKNAKLGGVRMIMPVKILGTSDGTYNNAAWQTEALFYNPLAGFTAAP